jgi:transposase
MLSFSGKTIYLCCGFTDMRKSINGLSAIVTHSFKLDLFAEAIFVFCNKNRDRIKILVWDEDGFWVYFKRLERGHFLWSVEGNKTITLSADEMASLLKNTKLVQKLKGKSAFVNTLR